MMTRAVEVVFPLPLNQTFTYSLPDDIVNIEVGSRVLVPFGNRRMTGYVSAVSSTEKTEKTKDVEAVLDDIPILTPDLLSLASNMARVYGTSIGDAVATMIPPGLTRQSKKKTIATDKAGEPVAAEMVLLLSRIRKNKGLDWNALARREPKMVSVVKDLEREGWVRTETALTKDRASIKGKSRILENADAFRSAPEVALTPEQQDALRVIVEALGTHEHRSILIHGVTGSGKTEVYLKATQEAFDLGKNVLALVPEISLTPQFVGRFRARFGDTVAILHSARSESERLKDWHKILRGELKIVIGARSAIFAPLRSIGLVIVDEEHDPSYKQEEGLLYNARDLARFRAEKNGAVFLMGSATPSLEMYERATREPTQLLKLMTRATGSEMAEVRLVDLRKKFSESGKKGIFSSELLEAISESLGRKEQAVLFLNRRGYAPVFLCPQCGAGAKCESCSVSLTYHDLERELQCHYCGHVEKIGAPCKQCAGAKWIPLGIGTEKVEQELNFHFPDARISRMDRDTVRKKGMHEEILSRFAKGDSDILIGTQMVTKGLDVPNVTLVGVLMADQSLHIPDFRAAERTFQLLTQVVGRAGRGAKKGRAIIQTFQPEHYAIEAGAAQDFEKFYEKEIQFRKEVNYPPFSSLSLIEIVGTNLDNVRESANWLAAQARRNNKYEGVDFLGPAPAPIAKIENNYRFHMIVRSLKPELSASFSRWLVSQAREPLAQKKIELTLDIDPYRMM